VYCNVFSNVSLQIILIMLQQTMRKETTKMQQLSMNMMMTTDIGRERRKAKLMGEIMVMNMKERIIESAVIKQHVCHFMEMEGFF